MATKKQNNRNSRKNAMRYTISEESPKRDSMRAARRSWGNGKAL